MRIIDMPEFKDKTEVLTFTKDTMIAKAVDEMAKKNYGAILITEEEKLTGIFTERDLLRRVTAARLDIETTALKEVMTTNIRTAKVNDKISDSLRRMSQGRFRHMPVIDDHGNLQGMLSQGDFVAYTLSDAIYRAGMSARANILSGQATPITILVALLLYSIGLIGIVAVLLN